MGGRKKGDKKKRHLRRGVFYRESATWLALFVGLNRTGSSETGITRHSSHESHVQSLSVYVIVLMRVCDIAESHRHLAYVHWASRERRSDNLSRLATGLLGRMKIAPRVEPVKLASGRRWCVRRPLAAPLSQACLAWKRLDWESTGKPDGPFQAYQGLALQLLTQAARKPRAGAQESLEAPPWPVPSPM